MNLSRIIERWAEHRPEKVALHYQGADWTYAALWHRIERATGELAARGISHGDRVAYLGLNHPDLLVLLFALARVGAIFVPLNARSTPDEHRTILADCAPKLLFHEPDLTPVAAQLPVATRVLEGDWSESTPAPPLLGADSDDLIIGYTSGTAGRSKGVVLQQSAFFWNGFNSLQAHDLSPADHVLHAMPMFHVGGLNIQVIPALLAGATVTLQRRFDPGQWLADANGRRPTMSSLVPPALASLVHHPNWSRTDLSSLKLISAGSMMVPLGLIRAFHARGVPIVQTYGCTETAPTAIVLLKEDAFSKVGSAGKPALHSEVKLAIDDRGTEAPPQGIGEVWVRGPNLMRGYWNDPQATGAALVGGWFRTGDLARRDADGFYWIEGRLKDVIISGGEKVSPSELENVLADCPLIAEAAVVGIPDPKWGEAPCACVVRKPQADLDAAGVLALFEGRVARFKIPRLIVFLDALPKSALGKVRKAELRALVAAESA